MKLEDQVCNLELAKRLKELGVKQESQFYWVKAEWGWSLLDVRPKEAEWCSAFTVAELGEMLPPSIMLEGWKCGFHACRSGFSGEFWLVGYEREQYSGNPRTAAEKAGDTEADARAKMLIYLIENKLIKPSPGGDPGPEHEK